MQATTNVPKLHSGLNSWLVALVLAASSSACASNSPTPSQTTIPDSTQQSQNHDMVSFARQYIGADYMWGGVTPKGFDCSGFIQFVYNEYDINIPRTTAHYPSLYSNKIALEDAQVGDLIIFTGTDPKIRKPGHAGIITRVGKSSLHFIHSSSSKKHFGVTETNYYKSGYPKRYLTVVRMSDETTSQ